MESNTTLTARDQLCDEGIRLVGRLAHTVKSLRTYSINSPAIRFGLEGMASAGAALVAMSEGPVQLRLSGDRVAVGDYPVSPPPGMLEAVRFLRAWLRERGIAGIVLADLPTAEDIKDLLRVLYELDPDHLEEDEANTALQKLGVQRVRFLACRPGDGDEDGDEDPAVGALRVYLRAARDVQRLIEQGPEPAVLLELNRAAQGLVDLVLHDPTRAMVLTTGRGVLPYAVTHPIHRLLLAVVAGRRLGMQPRELLELGLCALSADLGLHRLPEGLLSRAAPLTPGERGRMQLHTVQTVAVLLGAGELSPALRRRLLVAFELHLGADRSGYPEPLVWPELHPFSRLIAVVDTYDALVSVRPWRPARTPAEALAILQEQRGKHYDALMVDELEEVLRTHLPGTLP